MMKRKPLGLRLTMLLLLSSILLLCSLFTNSASSVQYFIAPVIIAAGISAAASGGNALATSKLNKKTRQWNEKMYATQRADALADWQMQNAYNSPEQQMARLEQAGLNPNLVYGDGATAVSNTQVRSSDTGNLNPQTPRYGDILESAGNGILRYQDLKAKTAQTDNVTAQTEQVQEQTKSIQIKNAIDSATQLVEINTRIANLNAILQENKKKGIDTDIQNAELQKLQAMLPYIEKTTKQQYDNLVQEGENLKATGVNIGKQGKVIDSQKDVNDAQVRSLEQNIKESITRQALIRAEQLESQSRKAKNEEERQNIIKQRDSIVALTGGQQLDNVSKALDAALAARGIRKNESYFGLIHRVVTEMFSSFGPTGTSYTDMSDIQGTVNNILDRVLSQGRYERNDKHK